MLAAETTAPQSVEKCAIVDVVPNVVVWYNNRSNASHEATYKDFGEGDIVYSREVPRIVEILVEHRTGKRIRFGCK